MRTDVEILEPTITVGSKKVVAVSVEKPVAIDGVVTIRVPTSYTNIVIPVKLASAPDAVEKALASHPDKIITGLAYEGGAPTLYIAMSKPNY